jgi:polar amino acid transport system substrate-binding protein
MLDRLAKETFARAGVPVTLVTLPSERGLISAASGDTDGDINRVAGLSVKYPELVQVQEKNMVYEFMAFTRRQDLSVRSWDDLRGLDVGFITGWKILEENVVARTITKVDNPAQLFALLRNDRVDVIIFDRWGGGHYLSEFGLTDVLVVEPPLAVHDMYLYLNREYQTLVPHLEQALRSIKADGTYERIFGQADGRP